MAFGAALQDYYKNTDFINTRLDAFENNQRTYNQDLYATVARVTKTEHQLTYCHEHLDALEQSETFTFCEKRLKALQDTLYETRNDFSVQL